MKIFATTTRVVLVTLAAPLALPAVQTASPTAAKGRPSPPCRGAGRLR